MTRHLGCGEPKDRVKLTWRALGRPCKTYRGMEEQLILTNLAEHHKIRVLVIDDRTIFLRSLSAFLLQVPEVEVVGVLPGCEGAVAQAQLLGAQVVILGLTTSGLPELQVIARLHDTSPEIKVIVLTLRDLPPYREAALGAGAADFVSRVHAGTDLLPAIRKVGAMIEQSKRCQAPGPAAAEKKPKHSNTASNC
jgi:DNA-binding NarL/FixJ family response regulator